MPAWLEEPDGYLQAGARTNVVAVCGADLTSLPRGWPSPHNSEYRGATGLPDPRLAGAVVPAASALVGALGWSFSEELLAPPPSCRCQKVPPPLTLSPPAC